MWRKILFWITIVLIVGGLMFALTRQQNIRDIARAIPTPLSQDKADYTARFAIFTHGTFRIFSAAMYHNLSPEVFIQSNNPNIVRVKKNNLTWNDFFSTLPFKLTKQCLTTGEGEQFCTGNEGTLKFYLNGKRDDDMLNRIIQPRDAVLVSFGNENGEQIRKQLEGIPDLPE